MKRGVIKKKKVDKISRLFYISKRTDDLLREVVENQYNGDEQSKSVIVERGIMMYLRKYYKDVLSV